MFALCSGTDVIALEPARDYKRLLAGDLGPEHRGHGRLLAGDGPPSATGRAHHRQGNETGAGHDGIGGNSIQRVPLRRSCR